MKDKNPEQEFLFALDALECAQYFINTSIPIEKRSRFTRRVKSLLKDLKIEFKKQFGHTV